MLRRRKLHRAAIKKQKRRRTLFLTACGLAAVLLIVGIVLLCRGCGHTEGRSHNESIYGSFAMSDRNCVYTFREDGSGELRLSGAPYRFRFTLSGKTLSIDFEAEALTDCEYSYDMLTTDEFSGEDILIAEQPDVCDAVVKSIMTDKLRKAILKLTDEKQLLIYRHYTPVFQAQTLPKFTAYHNRQSASESPKSEQSSKIF